MEWIELGALAEINNGYAFKSKKYKDEGIRIIRITNVQKGYIEDSDPKFYSEEDMEGLERFYLFEEDILISLTGNVGRVARVTKEILPAALNQRVASIKPNETINNDYLFHMMNSNKFEEYCINESKGVAQKNLGTTALSKMKIPVPSIEIQKHIVEILNHAQNLIDNRKEQIELLDDLIESIFYNMFGDPVMNDKGWEVDELGNFYDVKTGKTPRRGVNKFWENPEVNWIKTGEVLNGVINSTSEKVSKQAVEELNMYIFEKGDILIAMYGQGNTRGRVSKLNLEATTNQACAGLVQKKNSIINNEYTYNILLLLYEQLRNLGRGGNQPNLNLSMIREYEIPIPPISLQNKFAEKVQAIEKQKELMERSLELMEDNYNSLMQRAFKGKLF